jgi:hypothetical protein
MMGRWRKLNALQRPEVKVQSTSLSNDPRLLAQRLNLIDFVKLHALDYTSFRYSPWTSAAHEGAVRIGPSEFLPGLLGAFPVPRTLTKSTMLSGYPGVVMWDELYEEFNEKFHCPTAVEVPILDYNAGDAEAKQLGLQATKRLGPNKWLVKVLVVGDPIHVGSIFNSPFGLKTETGQDVQPNCRFETCREERVSEYLKFPTGPHEPIQVSGNIVHIHWDSPKLELTRTAKPPELLFNYDHQGSRSFFTKPDDEEAHCERCFSKFAAEQGPKELVLCTANGKDDCPFLGARHRGCFELGDFSHASMNWYCTRHRLLRPVVVAMPKPSLNATPPAAARCSAVLLEQPPTTSTASMPKPHHSTTLRYPSVSLAPSQSTSSSHCLSHCWVMPTLDATPPSQFHRAEPPDPPGPAQRLSRPCNLLDELSESAVPMHLRPPPRHWADYDSDDDAHPEEVSWSPPRSDEDVEDFDERKSQVQRRSVLGYEDSSSGSDSESDLDSDDSEADGKTEPLPRSLKSRQEAITRAQSLPANTRTIVLPKTFAPPMVQLSNEGKGELRRVWEEFDIAKVIAKDKRRVEWNIRPGDYGTKKENDFNRRLLKAFHNIRRCCATTDKIIERTDGWTKDDRKSVLTMFDSPSTFLRSWLHHFQLHGFDQSKKKKEVVTLLESDAVLFKWRGYPLCLSCWALALGRGFSRASMFTVFRSSHAPPEVVASIPIRRKKKVELVASLLINYGRREHQSDPTGEQSMDRYGCFREVLIMKEQTMQECLRKLTEHLKKEGQPMHISKSTFERAVTYAKEHHKVVLHLRKWKGVARCVTCETVQNKIDHYKKKRNATKESLYRSLMHRHNNQFRGQRDDWDRQKELALRMPWEICAASFDFIDQSKLDQPHYARLTKSQHVENQLKVRLLGVVAFGFKHPLGGITSFEDVKAKGGNGAVTNLMMVLEQEWKAMNPKLWEPIPTQPFDPAYIPADVKVHDNPVLINAKDQEPFRVDENWKAREDPASDGRVAFMWPKHLRLTFDNATSDFKHAQMFTFLAMLVAIGVFDEITVSNLLVGHTHDIVDQMFSVWAAELKRTDAPTVRKLHKLCQGNFQSKIYALRELLTAQKKKEHAEAVRARSAAAVESKADEEKKDEDEKKDEEYKYLSPIAGYLVDVAQRKGVRPSMQHQTFTVDANAWCLKKIPGITKPHNFYIRRELNGKSHDGKPDHRIVLYSKWMANSVTEHSEVAHQYPNVPHGGWTRARTIFHSVHDEVPREDPNCEPLFPIETDPVRLCVAQHVAEHNMTPEDAAEWRELLDGFDEDRSLQKKNCRTCHDNCAKLAEIGPISAVTETTTDADKLVIEAKTKRKKEVQEAQRHHIRTGAHSKLDGWWTGWLQRVEETITPYYLARGIGVDHKVQLPASEQLRGHPDLPHDVGAPAILETRVDRECHAVRGPPKVKDWILCRGTDSHYPFWVGRVKSVKYLKRDSMDWEYTPPSSSAAATNARSSSSSAAAGPAASSSSTVTALARPARAAKAAGRSLVDIDEDEDEGEEEEKQRPVKKSASHQKKGRKAKDDDYEERKSEDSDDDDDDSDDDDQPEDDDDQVDDAEAEDEDDRPLVAPPAAPSRGRKRASSRSREPRPRKSSKSVLRQSPAAGTKKKSSAAKPSSAPPPAPTASSRRKRGGRQIELREVESVEVEWWGPKESAYFVAHQLLDADKCDAYLKEVYDARLAKGEIFQSRREELDAAWKECKRTMSLAQFGKVPPEVVERWRPVEWLKDTSVGTAWIDSASWIVWGESGILNSDNRLSKTAFEKVFEDLTELDPKELAAAAASPSSDQAPAPAAAAAASSSRSSAAATPAAAALSSSSGRAVAPAAAASSAWSSASLSLATSSGRAVAPGPAAAASSFAAAAAAAAASSSAAAAAAASSTFMH